MINKKNDIFYGLSLFFSDFNLNAFIPPSSLSPTGEGINNPFCTGGSIKTGGCLKSEI
jgi:hypothetical protein